MYGMRKRAAIVIALVALMSRSAAAQSGVVTGTVRDSADHPLPDVDVLLIPVRRHVRSDSAGRFTFRAIDDGQYVLRVQRIGYTPAEWSVKLSKGGRVDVPMILGPRIARLDTVRVEGARQCSRDSYEGYMCRRSSAKGVFIDYTDIDTMQVDYSAELLRDVGGFLVEVQPTKTGPTRIASSRHCTIVLMDGVPVSWSRIPEAPYMITAIEVYKSRKEIPKEFARYTWGKEDCWLVAYWTYDFMYKPIRGVAPGRR
jgi:carboxypeptidase family protein